MELIPYSTAEWTDLGKRISQEIQKHGGSTNIVFTYFGDNGAQECTAQACLTNAGLAIIDGPENRHWYDSFIIGRIANVHTPDWPQFENNVMVPLINAARALGREEGVLVQQGETLKRDFSNATTAFQERCALLDRAICRS